MCLDYDGNLLDACIITLLAALKNGKQWIEYYTSICKYNLKNLLKLFFFFFVCFPAQLPKVTINKETDLPEVDMQHKTHLQINKHPVASSFAVFDE